MRLENQQQVFAGWLREHAAILHHVARAFAVGSDRHDLMQELLLTLWRAAPKFRGEARVSTFIYRVAHNAALAWFRRERQASAKLETLDPVMADKVPASDMPAEDDRLELLYAAIRELTPLDRSMILLHLDERPYDEIAGLRGPKSHRSCASLRELHIVHRGLAAHLSG